MLKQEFNPDTKIDVAGLGWCLRTPVRWNRLTTTSRVGDASVQARRCSHSLAQEVGLVSQSGSLSSQHRSTSPRHGGVLISRLLDGQQWAAGNGQWARAAGPSLPLPNLCWARILNVETAPTYCQNREMSGCMCIQNVPDAVLHFLCRALGIDLWRQGERGFCSGSRLDHEEALQQPQTACMKPSATPKTTAATEFPSPVNGTDGEIARLVSKPNPTEKGILGVAPSGWKHKKQPNIRTNSHQKEGGRYRSVVLYFCTDVLDS